jgi:aspartyl-tRNA(Asn)/glutamyl-tRNA(Gln) amidotransferase subunit A
MHKLGMGTTSLDSAFGPVINPWNARYVAGGSSGGSAVAIAAGLCFATIDTDAVGSGRLPAAICGVTCLKPTFGRMSTTGILAGEKADPAILLLSHPCITARSAADVTLAFRGLTGAAQDAVGARAVQRIGVATNFTGTDSVRAAFAKATGHFAALGLTTAEIDVPFERATFDVSGIERARATINAELFANLDAIALPTLAAPTPEVDEARARGDMAVATDNTFFCNYFGLPAVSIPSGVDRNGLPLALQFVGPQGSDDTVLWLARAYQQAMGWHFSPPEALRSRE